MCFELDARPPDLPPELVVARVGGGAAAEVTELPCADADEASFGAALALVDRPAAGLVVLPDIRGLYPFYIELAERFAAAGKHAVTLDYFGRTAGTEVRGEDFDFMAHLAEVTPEQVQLDIATARDALRERADVTAVLTVGFCFGGAQSFLAAGNADLDLDGAIDFYGTLKPERIGMPFAMPAPLRHVEEARCPFLGLFAGDDELIPPEDLEAFDRALGELGIDKEIVTYPGAPHSFFDRAADDYADESADAWRRAIAFADRISAGAAA